MCAYYLRETALESFSNCIKRKGFGKDIIPILSPASGPRRTERIRKKGIKAGECKGALTLSHCWDKK
jgi:hypothetical protein